MKSKTLLLLRAAISIALMAFLIYIMRGSIPKMLGALKRLPISAFLAALLLFFSGIAIVAFRLKILLATQRILLPVSTLIKFSFVGLFFSSFLPTSVGGDVVKAFYISRISNKPLPSYMSVFMDRFLGMFTISLIAAITLFRTANISQPHLRWAILLLLVGGIFVLLLFFNRRMAKVLSFLFAPALPPSLKEKFKDIYNTVHEYKKYKLEIVKCLLISLVAQITTFSAVCIFAFGLKSPISLTSALLSMSIASIVSMFPSIYGMGPREMSIVFILSPFVGKDKALAIAFLWLGSLLITSLIGGLIYAFSGMYRTKPSNLST